MIEYYSLNSEGFITKNKDFIKNCWINLIDPSKEEINLIKEKFNLDEDNIADGLDIFENPRLEINDEIIYLYLTVPTNNIGNEFSSSFLAIYSKNFFITLSKNNLEIFNDLLKIKFNNFTNSTKILNLMSLVSKCFEKSVYKIQKDIKLNKRDLDKLKNEDITKLIHDEDKLNNYLSSFNFLLPTYHKVLRDKTLKIKKDEENIINDLIIDLSEIQSIILRTLKSISNTRNYYSTKLSNDLNNTVKILTVFTIFLSIPTLISSIYGMNVTLPFQSQAWIFGGILFLMALVLTMIFFLFKKVKLI